MINLHNSFYRKKPGYNRIKNNHLNESQPDVMGSFRILYLSSSGSYNLSCTFWYWSPVETGQWSLLLLGGIVIKGMLNQKKKKKNKKSITELNVWDLTSPDPLLDMFWNESDIESPSLLPRIILRALSEASSELVYTGKLVSNYR